MAASREKQTATDRSYSNRACPFRIEPRQLLRTRRSAPAQISSRNRGLTNNATTARARPKQEQRMSHSRNPSLSTLSSAENSRIAKANIAAVHNTPRNWPNSNRQSRTIARPLQKTVAPNGTAATISTSSQTMYAVKPALNSERMRTNALDINHLQ